VVDRQTVILADIARYVSLIVIGLSLSSLIVRRILSPAHGLEKVDLSLGARGIVVMEAGKKRWEDVCERGSGS